MVGLGNPGAEYAGTRHNMGAEAVAVLAARYGVRLRSEKRLYSLMGEAKVDGQRLVLAVPTTYMNDSGVAVVPLVRRSGLPVDQLTTRMVVIHDELDLPSGRVKLKVGGGHAGNNGLKSIEQHLHTRDYLRIRVGIGKPPGRQSGADFVLKRPAATERELLGVAIEQAADVAESILAKGVEITMNWVNRAE